jgi:hypothetical protein
MHLLPNPKVFYSASTSDSHLFDPVTNSRLDAAPGTPPTTVTWTIYGADGERTYGSSVRLPLTPSTIRTRSIHCWWRQSGNGYDKVIDLAQPTTEWEWKPAPKMAQARVEMEETLLPSGKVLVCAGSVEDENVSTASLKAERYDPATNNFSSAELALYPGSTTMSGCS